MFSQEFWEGQLIPGMPTLVDFGVDVTARKLRIYSDEYVGGYPILSVEVYGQPICKFFI